MKNITERIILENIHFTQILLHDLDEQAFNSCISKSYLNFQNLHSYVINLVHQLNDKHILNETYLKAISHFLDIEQVENVNNLISVLNKKRVQSNEFNSLTFNEVKNFIQCIKFIANDNNVDINRISGITELTNVVREMNKYELV